MNRLRRGLFAALAQGGGAVGWSVVCPAITPTAGADEIANGEFTSDYTGWTANNATLSVVDSASDPGTASGGADSNCLKVVDGGSEAGALSADLGVTANVWHRLTGKIYCPAATDGLGRVTCGTAAKGENIVNLIKTLTSTWQSLFGTFLSTLPNCYVSLFDYGAPNDRISYFDSISLVPLTFASLISTLIQTNPTKNGTYICHPTVVDNTHCGMLLNYLNATNFVMAVVDRSNPSTAPLDTAKLLKCIAGTYSIVKSGNITYVAGADLKVVVSGTTFQLFYNGTQVSTDGTIDNSGLGLDVYGFSTYASNTVGIVTGNP